ncbi:outer membrane protein assembly factor BamA [Rubrolithibacter danxiaensis]|uniref:outer membrane protein assembly factor BamA n=1 Tax=Rubrolithibacter danxiaensis TaxID=3390805 RepID=UPI003BF81299
MNKFLITLYFLVIGTVGMAQIRLPQSGNSLRTTSAADTLSYLNPKEFTIGGTSISGVQYLDTAILVQISKLNKGDKIIVPGDATSNAIKNLWSQGLFDDVQLNIKEIRGDSIFFNINVVERPRLTRIELKGLKKSEKEEVQKKLSDKTGKIVNENLINTTTNTIKKFFTEKGFLFTDVEIKQRKDESEPNSVVLEVTVDKHSKVRVNSIAFEGNKNFSDRKLRKFFKKTKQKEFYKIFGTPKFLREKYEEDKERLITKMQAKGYRDAEILSDTIIPHNKKTVDIKIKLHEGPKYYFGNIEWAGNAKYPTKVLETILGIQKGDVFSEEKLEKKLRGSPSGDDVSSLYLNDGYLTFNVNPVQTKVYGDTIDLELRMYEGPQYTVNKIILKGNDITNDKVVRREIRTKPGQKFSKEAVVRTTREIATLGNFDEAKTDVKPIPNPSDGTVDIEYTVAEKPSDQIELSGGFGGGRIIGTLGLTFNNFSARNLFNFKEWKPLPKGDGQKLSIRGQTNGRAYQSYSFSFSEPWLGGKKPVYFGVSVFTSLQSNDFYNNMPEENLYRIRLNGVTVSLGQRLKWPDDYFQISHSINIQEYRLKNYPYLVNFRNGSSYNFNLTQEISRNSLDQPIFPTSGSNLRLTIQATPPYSLFNNINYRTASDKDRYKFTEYYKMKFDAQWYQRIYGKLVLKAQSQFGFLGRYNTAAAEPVFERFKLGGDGMQGFDYLKSSEIIALRGYENGSVIPIGSDPDIARESGSPIYSKYILELRHPVADTQQAKIYLLAFAEGGNTWNTFKDFNPFNVRRSVGVGARVFLPIFGLLGIDYGYGFDRIPGLPDANKGQFHFSIAQQMGGFN